MHLIDTINDIRKTHGAQIRYRGVGSATGQTENHQLCVARQIFQLGWFAPDQFSRRQIDSAVDAAHHFNFVRFADVDKNSLYVFLFL